MTVQVDVLARLQKWYLSQCDGDWEHQYGVEICTVDNPGWRGSINLAETYKEEHVFKRIKIERSEDDWIHAWKENNKFEFACSPENLQGALEIFLNWANSGDIKNN